MVAGDLALIELAEARWFIDPSRKEPMEAARALYIIAHRRGALADVRAYEAGDTERLNKAASAWIADHPEITADLAAIHRLVIAPIATGFSLLPSNGGIDGEWWFGSEWLGGIVAAACRMGLGTWDAVMWDIPFALIGHAIAGKARQEDVKGVGRRLDEDAVDREIAAAEEREKRGELHPWQIASPEGGPAHRREGVSSRGSARGHGLLLPARGRRICVPSPLGPSAFRPELGVKQERLGAAVSPSRFLNAFPGAPSPLGSLDAVLKGWGALLLGGSDPSFWASLPAL